MARRNRIFAKLMCTLFAVSMLTFMGCTTDFTKDTPFDTGTPTESVTPTNETTNPTPTSNTVAPTPSVSDPTSVPTDKVTDVPATNTATPTQAATTPTVTEAVPTETEATATPTQEPSKRDAFDRDEYWDRTFLVWLPKFKAGSFSGQDSAGTFDYATFTEVNADEVKDYIGALKEAGFTNIGSETYSDGAITFSALNGKSWEAKISFTGSTMVLGSGFNDGSEGNDDKVNALYSTTMLQYMPKFTKGSYVSSETRSDSSMFTSIIYTGVTIEDAISYIEKVKEKGYIYVEDEDSQDGALWYIALNEERFECQVEFSGSELKIGCGYMDED